MAHPPTPESMEKFAGRVLGDLASAMHAGLTYLGDRLGLFKAMAGAGPLTPEELAARSGVSPRYAAEWLGGMVAGEYVTFHADRGAYELSLEGAAVLSDEGGPAFMGGFFHMWQAMISEAPRVLEAFRSGAGVRHGDHHPELYEAFVRALDPTVQHLLPRWIGSIPEVAARLEAGGSVLDVGCGPGSACVALARAFPRARIFGIDRYAPWIERGRATARAAGVEARVTLEVGDWSELPRAEYDVVTALDVVHDAGDPIVLLTSIRNALKPEGTCVVQELNAVPDAGQNVHPIGKFLYAGSTFYCLGASLADHGPGFGSLLGRERLFDLARRSGLSRGREVPTGHPLFALFAFGR